MGITTTAILPSPVQQWFSSVILSTPTPNMIHKIAAQKKTLPRNGGNTLRMRRYNALATAMVPLGQSGVMPPPQELTAVDRLYVHIKSSLIDLEAYCLSYGDKAQAYAA